MHASFASYFFHYRTFFSRQLKKVVYFRIFYFIYFLNFINNYQELIIQQVQSTHFFGQSINLINEVKSLKRSCFLWHIIILFCFLFRTLCFININHKNGPKLCGSSIKNNLHLSAFSIIIIGGHLVTLGKLASL